MIDLHTHSNYSDGSFSPKELVALALSNKLYAIALTDHNTFAGLEEFNKNAAPGLNTVCGIEISSAYDVFETHIVGLFIDKRHYAPLQDMLDEINRNKIESNEILIKNLNASGYKISYDDISQTCKGVFNRSHVARVLVSKGYAYCVSEAITNILSVNRGIYVPSKRLQALSVIKRLRSLNVVSVIAHPLVSMPAKELLNFLPEAKKLGLTAMETYYSEYDTASEYKACEIADSIGLLRSGGSDFHGLPKPDISLGIGKGSLNISDEIYLTLREAYEHLRSS